MLKYAINMHKYAQNKLYAKNMQIICTNMLKICIKYAKKKYGESMQLQRFQHAKYAKKNAKNICMNMQKKLYRKQAETMQNIHESVS